jgi:hypothetical protein
MYVRDLEDGILIKPIGRWEWAINSLHQDRDINAAACKELKHFGVYFHSTVSYTPKNKKNRRQSTAVYLGKHVLQNNYYGVKTQHLVLIDGVTAAMDGYSFRDVEKVS